MDAGESEGMDVFIQYLEGISVCETSNGFIFEAEVNDKITDIKIQPDKQSRRYGDFCHATARISSARSCRAAISNSTRASWPMAPAVDRRDTTTPICFSHRTIICFSHRTIV